VAKQFSIFKRLYSWIAPRELTHFPTTKSGEAYIYLYKGELMLCTQTATYSHGLQYTPFGIAFKYLQKIKKLHPQKFLLLGGGLEKYGLAPETTIVEIEPSYKKASAGFLPTALWQKLDWHTEDAFQFVANCKEQYDMIGIDLFIHLSMLDDSLKAPFLLACKQLLAPDGIVIMNTFFEQKEKAVEFQHIFETIFTEVTPLVNDRNYVFIGR
jgi:Spermine/spermidine synthase domain